MFSDRVFLFLEIILNFYSGWSLIFQSFYFSVFYRRCRQVGFFVSRRVTHQLQEQTRRPGAGGGSLDQQCLHGPVGSGGARSLGQSRPS